MLVSDLLCDKQLEDSSISAFLVNINGLSFSSGYEISGTRSLLDKANKYNKLIIFNLNLYYEENDLALVIKFIEDYKDDNCLFLTNTIGLLTLANKEKFIYQGNKILTNHLDIDFYQDYCDSVVIANEITYDDILDIVNNTTINKGIEVFGHLLLSVSKRHFLSYYFDQINSKDDSNDIYYLQEEKRDYLMPIIQNCHGSKIYTPYLIDMINELHYLNENFKYLFLNSFDIAVDKYLLTCELFNAYLDDSSINIKDQLIDIYSDVFSSGFLYKKTTLIKED
ncbi:MAG: U32 family peptidase [Erysipelotrichaceae bacterium]